MNKVQQFLKDNSIEFVLFEGKLLTYNALTFTDSQIKALCGFWGFTLKHYSPKRLEIDEVIIEVV